MLPLAADSNAIAQRHNHGVQFPRSVDQLVEALDAVRLLRLGLSGDKAPPARIVCDEQTAPLHAGQCDAKSLWVLFLVHVTEDEIELALLPAQQFERVSHPHCN